MHREAVSMSTARASSSERPRGAITYRLRPSLTRRPNQNGNGQLSKSGGISLEPHSPTEVPDDRGGILDAQLRESFGRVVYSHKAHEKQADILLSRLSKVKLAQIVLPAIATGGFVTVLVGTGWWGSLVGGIFSAGLLALNLFTRNFDLGREAQQHREAAINIWYIREKYLSLIVDLAMGCESLSNIRKKRDALADELKEIYINSPSTTEAAYKKAHKALNLEEEMTFSVSEVDAFLPEPLRRTE